MVMSLREGMKDVEEGGMAVSGFGYVVGQA